MADPKYEGDDWSPAAGSPSPGMDSYTAAIHASLPPPTPTTMPSSTEAMALDTPNLPLEHMQPEAAGSSTVPRTQRLPRQRVRGRPQRHSSYSRADYPPMSQHQIKIGNPLGSPAAAALAGDPSDPVGQWPMQGPELFEVGAPSRAPYDYTQHYPIRASVQNRAIGLGRGDSLVAELTSVAENLPELLGTILSNPPLDPTADYDAATTPVRPDFSSSALVPATSSVITNCRGVTGIGGAMVPVKHPAYPTPDQLQAYAAGANPPPTPSSSRDGPQPAPDTTASKNKTPVKQEPGFKTSFQFVINESAKDARNTVRKHVMREYRRRERWEQDRRKAAEGVEEPTSARPKRRRKSAKASTSEAVNQETKLAQTLAEMSSSASSGGVSPTTPNPAKRPRMSESLQGKSTPELAAVIPNFEEALEELERNKDLPYMADPWAAIAASDVDPFSRMQMELGPATRSLLHHFAWVMPSLMDEVVTGTVFNRLGWLYSAVAVHDPKPAHVILGFTLGHLAGLRGIKEPPLAIEHKNRAFELISQRMSDPELAISDDNIGAVVNVAGWELIDCNPEAFALHMRALHQMVVVRGGIGAFAHKPELQTVLVRLDAIRAYITLSQPRYPTYACFRSLPPLAIGIPPSRLNPAIPPLAPENPEHAFCEDTFYLLHALEDSLLLLKSVSKDHPGNKFPASVKELVVANVQACLAPTRILPSSFSRSRSRHVTRLAALVFIDAAIQHFCDSDAPDSGAKRLTTRFLGQRADKAAMAAWGRSLEMVIHVLLAADRLALERPWRAWYFADALTLTMKLGNDAWAAVDTMLRDYLDERCREVEQLVGARSAELWSLKRVLEAVELAWSQWWELGEQHAQQPQDVEQE
jgi:hypothetical protein